MPVAIGYRRGLLDIELIIQNIVASFCGVSQPPFRITEKSRGLKTAAVGVVADFCDSRLTSQNAPLIDKKHSARQPNHIGEYL